MSKYIISKCFFLLLRDCLSWCVSVILYTYFSFCWFAGIKNLVCNYIVGFSSSLLCNFSILYLDNTKQTSKIMMHKHKTLHFFLHLAYSSHDFTKKKTTEKKCAPEYKHERYQFIVKCLVMPINWKFNFSNRLFIYFVGKKKQY